MAIDFKSTRDRSLLKQAIEIQLPLRQATIADVQQFLNQQRIVWRHADSESPISASHLQHLISKDYDSFIYGSTPAPAQRWLWFFSSGSFFWELRFHFAAHKLVEIVITLRENNPV